MYQEFLVSMDNKEPYKFKKLWCKLLGVRKHSIDSIHEQLDNWITTDSTKSCLRKMNDWVLNKEWTAITFEEGMLILLVITFSKVTNEVHLQRWEI